MIKKCYLDSNVFVYFKDQNSLFHHKALNLIIKLDPKEYRLYISSLTIDEFLHSLKFILNKTGISQSEIPIILHSALESILTFEHLTIVNPPTDKNRNKSVVRLMTDFNLQPRDAYHLLTMKEHNINMLATFDNDFQKAIEKKAVRKFS